MNYTQNYHLPQWAKSDRILMDDFNQMCAAIDTGIKEAKTQANSAQSTANTAVNKKNYVTGSYTGSGEARTITLGFRPSFVIVSGMRGTMAENDYMQYIQYFGATGGHAVANRIAITSTGFTVNPQDISNAYYPNFTESGRLYDYIAFR